MNVTLELANKIAGNAQVAVRQSKAAINNGLQADIHTGIAYEIQAFAVCFATEDQKDAMTAFVNKTKVTEFKNK
jgi:enoyl-CoA hydratase